MPTFIGSQLKLIIIYHYHKTGPNSGTVSYEIWGSGSSSWQLIQSPVSRKWVYTESCKQGDIIKEHGMEGTNLLVGVLWGGEGMKVGSFNLCIKRKWLVIWALDWNFMEQEECLQEIRVVLEL